MKRNFLNTVILAYSRPDTFKQVFEACQAYTDRIKVVIDFPESKEIEKKQEQIFKIIENNSKCIITRREYNHGLVKSITRTVQEEVDSEGHVVLLEDDCVPHKDFFKFVKDSILKYEDDPKITSICGINSLCPFNPWGWATWKKKWKYEEFSVHDILQIEGIEDELKNILKCGKLERSIWSLNWLARQYLNNTTAVFPRKNLITNIGIDRQDGVHNSKKGYTAWLLSQMQNN